MNSEFGLGNQNLFEYYEQAEPVDMRSVGSKMVTCKIDNQFNSLIRISGDREGQRTERNGPVRINLLGRRDSVKYNP